MLDEAESGTKAEQEKYTVVGTLSSPDAKVPKGVDSIIQVRVFACLSRQCFAFPFLLVP